MSEREFDWNNVWATLIAIAVLGGLGVLGMYIFAPKNVDYYYLSTSNSGNRSLGFCAYAHWTWHTDEIAYCSDDKDKVLDFVAKANATIPHK